MNLILRSAAKGLLWGVVFAAGVALPQAVRAGDDWRGGAHADVDDGYGYGYGYGYGGDYENDVDYRGYGHGYDHGDRYGDRRGYGDAYWDRDGHRRGHGWRDGHRDRRWSGDHARHAGRVWCPQRRAYVLPWEVRGWRGDRHPRWRQRDRDRHWRTW